MKSKLAEIEHLKLNYHSVTAVKDVSFFLQEGEILAIIGPNGAGKTSTIECLEGLRKVTSGKVSLLGYNPYNNRKKIYEKVGIQLQASEFPDRIKVKEVCKLFASCYDSPADWQILLKKFNLLETANRYVNKLSGGERQRLSILLSLLPRPKVLILDELTTGLDPEVRRDLWDSLKQIRKTGTSILLVSHFMDEVEYLADRIVYLLNGKSDFVGTQLEFRSYAKKKISDSDFSDTLSLEDIYVLLAPKNNSLNLEGLL